MERFALRTHRTVAPGFTLRRERNEALWREMKALGAYSTDVLPDSSVVIRMPGSPHRYGYVYRITPPSDGGSEKLGE